jgi:hypothetical protein
VRVGAGLSQGADIITRRLDGATGQSLRPRDGLDERVRVGAGLGQGADDNRRGLDSSSYCALAVAP